ncbi:MAG: ABC transporter substrate-binding protein [Burkholderiaceae bacterium]|jgi:tripartite-type tricarboxylate transporter receptor subunit TctC|nr:ABC transporter substrate-binding protein [Burkholderiaceae bacterium]
MHRAPRTTRQRFLRTLACAVVVMAYTGSLWAQPATIRLVVGYPAGATSDLLTRVMAEEMSRRLNRPVIVENKAGAGGRIANELVKAAPADGTTLLMTPVATMAIFPHSYAGQLRYDPLKDFVPVAHLTNFQLGLGVGTAIPARSVKEYVDWVKSDPDKNGFYGSAAPGSIPHFFGVMLGQAAGIPMTHVPYKGTAAAMQALAAGDIAALSTVAADLRTLVRADRARLLAVAGDTRDPAFPDVPTFKELGYDLVAKPWYAMFAPAGTPAPVLGELSKVLTDAVRDPTVNARLVEMGLEPTGYDADRLGAILKADYERWGPVIRASGFRPGQ